MSDVTNGYNSLQKGLSILKGFGVELKSFVPDKETKANAKSFMEKLKEDTGEKHPSISDSNTTVYETKGRLVDKAAEELRARNVPCIVMKNEKTNSSVILVPKSLEARADEVIGEHNKIYEKQPDFLRENIGKTVGAVSLTEDQALLALRALKEQGVLVGNKAETTLEGNRYADRKLVLFKEGDARYVEAAAFMSKALTSGANGDKAREAIEAIRSSREAVGKAISTPSKMIAFSDADRGDKAPVYVINDVGLFRVEGKQRELMASRAVDGEKLAKTAAKLVSQMRAPVVKDAKGRDQTDGFFTRDEIRAAKEGMAIADAGSGKMEQAESIAAQIVALRISTDGLSNKGLAAAINGSVGFSAVIANGKSEDSYRLGVDELADKYAKLGLSIEEDNAVAEFIQDVYGETVRSESQKEIVTNDLSLKDISKGIDAEMGEIDMGDTELGDNLDRDGDGIPDDRDPDS